MNSAKSINENFGVGLFQVQKAWEYLQTHYDREDQDIAFEVSYNLNIYIIHHTYINKYYYLNFRLKYQINHEKNEVFI